MYGTVYFFSGKSVMLSIIVMKFILLIQIHNYNTVHFYTTHAYDKSILQLQVHAHVM